MLSHCPHSRCHRVTSAPSPSVGTRLYPTCVPCVSHSPHGVLSLSPPWEATPATPRARRKRDTRVPCPGGWHRKRCQDTHGDALSPAAVTKAPTPQLGARVTSPAWPPTPDTGTVPAAGGGDTARFYFPPAEVLCHRWSQGVAVSLCVPPCPFMSISIPWCPSMSLHVPPCLSVSLSVPRCPWALTRVRGWREVQGSQGR